MEQLAYDKLQASTHVNTTPLRNMQRISKNEYKLAVSNKTEQMGSRAYNWQLGILLPLWLLTQQEAAKQNADSSQPISVQEQRDYWG